jgi:plastocyanin
MTNALLRVCAAAVAAIPLLLAPHAAPADEGKTVVVTMTDDDEFKPAMVEVHVGDTVLWKNTTKVTHSITDDPKAAKNAKDVELPAGATPFNSGKLKGGMSFNNVFTTPGKYTYVCVEHEKERMIGHVVVNK